MQEHIKKLFTTIKLASSEKCRDNSIYKIDKCNPPEK